MWKVKSERELDTPIAIFLSLCDSIHGYYCDLNTSQMVPPLWCWGASFQNLSLANTIDYSIMHYQFWKEICQIVGKCGEGMVVFLLSDLPKLFCIKKNCVCHNKRHKEVPATSTFSLCIFHKHSAYLCISLPETIFLLDSVLL